VLRSPHCIQEDAFHFFCFQYACGGRAEGADLKSFRVEGYGMLAILRLTFHLQWFYMTRNPLLLFTVYSDSESLIKRLHKSLLLTYLVSRRTLFAEANVEMQILDALAAFTTCPALVHAVGHQDENYPDRLLGWPARLNQKCNEVATQHLESATNILSITLVFPACHAILTVQATTIIHHIPSQLCSFAGLTAHRAYLCRHHDWTPTIFDLVSWKLLHSCSLAIPFLKRLFLIKWINDLLPFQRQQVKFKQSPSSACPSSCGYHDKDWRHFLRCTHPHQCHVWREFRDTISPIFERHNIDPSLC
jgi:hypothetical protein